MRILLDTDIVIWAMIDPGKLSPPAGQAIEKATAVVVSAVSVWEIGIKAALGKLQVDMDDLIASLDDAGAERLPVTWDHALAERLLPPHHRDPFDRMLIAQATSEPLQLLTSDKTLARYGGLITLV